MNLISRNFLIYLYFRDEEPMHISAAIWYNIAQSVVYAIMAIGIMRLKLFLTPHLCILAGLMAKEKVTAKISRPVKFLFLLLFPPFIAGKKFKLYECIKLRQSNVELF